MSLRGNLLLRGLKGLLARYFVTRNSFGYIHKTSIITPPVVISGKHNIYISDNVNIGANSMMYATHAKITIKKGFVAAQGLRLISGSHERRVGEFLYSITDENKDLSLMLDRDIVVEEDVWAGMNVTVLRGVTLGRGCTLAAGSVVAQSTPPYSIVGGVPARFIKFYWTIEQILEHEAVLYSESERYTKDYLEAIFAAYSK